MTRHIEPGVLFGYLLGESADESSATVERHLAECASCRRQESELRHLIRDFAGATAPRPRADILDSLLAAQHRLRDARRRRALPRGFWAVGTVAAVLGAFAVGFWTGRSTSADPRAERPAGFAKVDAAGAREPDLAAPHVTFVAAIPDRVTGLARQDTTAN